MTTVSETLFPFLSPYSQDLKSRDLKDLPKSVVVAIHGLLTFIQQSFAQDAQGQQQVQQNGDQGKKIAHLHRSLKHLTDLSRDLSRRLNQTRDDFSFVQSRSSARIQKLEQEKDAVIMVNEMLKRRLAMQTDGPGIIIAEKFRGKEKILNDTVGLKVSVHRHSHFDVGSSNRRSDSLDSSSFSGSSFEDAHDEHESKSRQLISDLTSTLERERFERTVEREELTSQNEILKEQLGVREEELLKFWSELDEFLGLKGFVYSKSMGMVEGSESESENLLRKSTKVDDGAPKISIQKLEKEIVELEEQLKSVRSQRAPSPLKHLNSQISQLMSDVKSLEQEREQLNKSVPIQKDGEDFDLLRMRLENDNQHLLSLLRNSESHVKALEDQLAEQEEEFEGIAQRIKGRLEAQRQTIEEQSFKIEEQANQIEASSADISTIFESLEDAERALKETAELLQRERDKSCRLEALLRKDVERSRTSEHSKKDRAMAMTERKILSD